ncbi:MAG: PIN domain-containing protein [Pseudomonadota bacterium]
MRSAVLLDTGPLVSLLNARDRHYVWAKQQFATIKPPLFTCEAVISEACHIILRGGGNPQHVIQLAEIGFMDVSFPFSNHVPAVNKLMKKYRDLPISFADACLVRMSELRDSAVLLTLDKDFQIYRKHGRQRISVRLPADRIP